MSWNSAPSFSRLSRNRSSANLRALLWPSWPLWPSCTLAFLAPLNPCPQANRPRQRQPGAVTPRGLGSGVPTVGRLLLREAFDRGDDRHGAVPVQVALGQPELSVAPCL